MKLRKSPRSFSQVLIFAHINFKLAEPLSTSGHYNLVKILLNFKIETSIGRGHRDLQFDV